MNKTNLPQSECQAKEVFFGVEQPKNVAPPLGEPIPGYSGVNRRVQADNIFGLTYADARKKAYDSLRRIEDDKGETLKMNSTFKPEYTRSKQDETYY